MLFSMVYYSWVTMIFGLFAAVLLIVGLTFGFRLMKVSQAPAWAVACAMFLAAVFISIVRVQVVFVLLALAGIPLIGGAIYLLAKSSTTAKIGAAAGILLLVIGGLLTLAKTDGVVTRENQPAVNSMIDSTLRDQTARIRHRREVEDRRRRDLFESAETELSFDEVWADNSDTAKKQVDSLKNSPGVAWYPEVDERFDSGIQPSMAATGQALGKKLIPLINSVRREERDPRIIDISATRTGPREDLRQVMTELATVMRGRYPEATVMVDRTSYLAEPNTLYIHLTMSVVQMLAPAPWDKAKSELLADVTAALGGKDVNMSSVSVRFVDKPWIHDFGQFVSSNRDSGLLIDARSGRLATSELEARNSAMEDAVNLLTPVAMEVLKAQRQPFLRTPDESEIADRIKSELLGGGLVMDRFSQQLAHPMGNLWREAILVRADYDSMQRVVSSFVQQRQAKERGQLSLAAALALLVCGVIVLHAFLNWVTKGYHRRRIGMLSGLVALGCVLFVLVLVLRLNGSASV